MRTRSLGSVLLLVILLSSVLTGVQALDQSEVSFSKPVVYEAVLINEGSDELQLPRLEADVPSGAAYVGLAAGSQVSQEAQRLGNGLAWEGPFTLPPGGNLTLRFWLAPTSPALQLPAMNVVAQTPTETMLQVPAGPGEPLSSVATDIEGATGVQDVTIAKVAETPALEPGDEPWIAYVITFDNNAATPAALDTITDTLAAGFSFVGMAVGSDVADQPPDPEAPVIVWEGPFVVPGSGTLTLRYWVRALTKRGTYVNTVEAAGDGFVIGPAPATVTFAASDSLVYLPSIMNKYPPPPPAQVDEDFLTGVPPEWQAVRLPTYWKWTGDGVTYGRYDFVPPQEFAEWALSLYLGQGAEEWTDYRIQSRFRTGWHFRGPLVGIWLRGTYVPATGRIGGYVFVLRPREDYLHLGYANPSAPGLTVQWADTVSYANERGTWYDIVIEIRGANIKAWINGNPVFDWTDPSDTWPKGTVGFAVFRGEGHFDDILVTPLE